MAAIQWIRVQLTDNGLSVQSNVPTATALGLMDMGAHQLIAQVFKPPTDPVPTPAGTVSTTPTATPFLVNHVA